VCAGPAAGETEPGEASIAIPAPAKAAAEPKPARPATVFRPAPVVLAGLTGLAAVVLADLATVVLAGLAAVVLAGLAAVVLVGLAGVAAGTPAVRRCASCLPLPARPVLALISRSPLVSPNKEIAPSGCPPGCYIEMVAGTW
jgi:hypothetical protein